MVSSVEDCSEEVLPTGTLESEDSARIFFSSMMINVDATTAVASERSQALRTFACARSQEGIKVPSAFRKVQMFCLKLSASAFVGSSVPQSRLLFSSFVKTTKRLW